MASASHNHAGTPIALLRNPGVAAVPHQRIFPLNSLQGALNHDATTDGGSPRSSHELWGGIVLAGASTLFWVPVLAYVCSALGASAGIHFWVAFAVVMFLLELCVWTWLRTGMREPSEGATVEAPAARVLSLHEHRRGRARTAQA